MDDIDERESSGDSLNVSEDIVSVRGRKEPGISEVDFDGMLNPPLRLHEDVTKGCGGQLWPAGMVLGKYMLREPQLIMLENKTILELGAGGGLVGLALALAFSRRVELDSAQKPTSIHLTDQAPMLPLMRRNIELNQLSKPLITASILDWGSAKYDAQAPNVILAADCVYFEPAFPLLLDTLKQHIGPQTVCYFCFKKRRKADMRFVKDARKAFNVEDVKDDPDKAIWGREQLFLYKITKK